ncbi:MAG: hypothetical protein V3V06_05130 [Dehalococcoidia bacterium]
MHRRSKPAVGRIALPLVVGVALVAAACGGGGAEPPPDDERVAVADLASAESLAEDSATNASAASDPTPEAETAAVEAEGAAAAEAGAGTLEPDATPDDDLAEEVVDPWANLRRDLLIELTDPAQVDLLREIGETVAERRGLPLQRDVPAYLIRRSDLAAYFLSFYDAEDLAEADFVQTAYRLLGIIDDDLEIISLLQELYVGLVLGFYDPDVDVFIIVSSNEGIASRDIETITHEFVHVLQDQHFDLGATFDDLSHNSDAALAYRFVVEGDARLSEALFKDLEARIAAQLEGAQDRLPGVGGTIPFVMERVFTAPYREGVIAIAALLAEGGIELINDLLAEPPDSTEQLLHLERLAAREPPLPVDDPDFGVALGVTWKSLRTDTLGEFFVRVLLDDELSADAAKAGADGWGGDRVAVYRSTAGEELLAWHLRWDSVDEGTEFFDTFAAWLDRRSGGESQSDDENLRLTWSSEERTYWVQGRAGETWILVGTEAAAVSRASALLAE